MQAVSYSMVQHLLDHLTHYLCFRLLFEYADKYPTQTKPVYCVIGTDGTTSTRTVTLTTPEKLEGLVC